MSYKLKNKNVVVLALSFAVMMAMSGLANAQDAAPFLFEDQNAENASPQTVENVNPAPETAKAETIDTSFLDEQPVDNSLVSSPAEEKNEDASQLAAENNTLFDDVTKIETDANEIAANDVPADEAIELPQSPFENFGNAILSKVDNDLFNQMSQIEKQTTILNLELKREDVRNKVEALKAARILARQEAEARRIAEEQKLKDMEMARQAKLLEAEGKLKEKEIELEKVRQAKLLNDYMNEVLVINQKWIEKSGLLQSRIHEMENERKTLIATIEEKIEKIRQKAEFTNACATDAVEKYSATLKGLNSQIIQLRKDIVDSETRIQVMREQSSTNPFAQSSLDPNAASTDLAQEYAIMDITGQGDDIVAKIVSRDGTTFTVHRGSVLRGGETVLKITEKYIAFDKKGIKAYLYPGGTIMEYEPVNIFNEAEKTPEVTEKQSFRSDSAMRSKETVSETTFGKPMNNERENVKTPQKAPKPQKTHRTNSLSFSEGMFAR